MPRFLAPQAAPPAPQYVPTKKRLPVAAIVGITIAAIGALGVGAAAVVSASNPMHDLTVELTVYSGDGCDLPFGYFDVPGAGVTVTVDDAVVARDVLPTTGDEDWGTSCTFSVNVGPVPADGTNYVLEIGDRGEVENSRDEVESNDWTMSASLG